MLSICNQWIIISTCVGDLPLSFRIFYRLTSLCELKIWSKQQQLQLQHSETMYQLRNQHAQHDACNVSHELNTDMQLHCARSGATLLRQILVAQTATCETPIVYRHSNSVKRAANPGSYRRSIRAMATKAELETVPGVSQPDPATKDFIFQQTMYRIKDPKKSLDFYTRTIGFRLIEKLDFPDSKFTLYFLGYHKAKDIPEDRKERVNWMFQQPATLELTHNWGTESDPEAKMHNGNDKPQGYGHIGFHVPDVDKACARFEELGVEFVKKPDAGNMKGLAFIKDPDGYWIEILNGKNSTRLV